MLDPAITAALVVLVTVVLKYLVSTYLPNFPITDELINTIAVAVVAFLLSLFGLELIKRTKAGKNLQERGLLK